MNPRHVPQPGSPRPCASLRRQCAPLFALVLASLTVGACGLDTLGISSSSEAESATTAPMQPCDNDAVIDEGEPCDDGDDDPLDGCTPACTPTRAALLSVGGLGYQTCAILRTGEARCWGRNTDGQTGYPPGDNDANELPSTKPRLVAPDLEPFTTVQAGGRHACARTGAGRVFCWGFRGQGRIGDGESECNECEDIGDLRPLDVLSLGDALKIPGGPVEDIAVGNAHTCALTEDHNVSCWGSNDKGQLGLGHDLCVGNLCAPDIVGLDLGDAAGKVEQVAAGVLHTCVRLATPVDNVMCWGYRAHGRLGYGDQDAEMAGIPSAAERGLVKLGARTAIDISVGEGFTCVVLDDHNARCWGQNNQGQLGQGDILSRGDSDETTPDRIPDIALGVAISKIRCGYEHVCALTSDQTVLCWGRNDEGQLGYGNTVNVGAVSPPIDAGAVDLGAAAIDLAVGKKHTCALLDTSEIKCWGAADDGQLGYGDEQIGDRATPASVGGVPFYPEP